MPSLNHQPFSVSTTGEISIPKCLQEPGNLTTAGTVFLQFGYETNTKELLTLSLLDLPCQRI